ncbi:hypothetical protein N658DRAFT_523851 [Parathielavia hyrcaniae]|uniref:C2H2-type domain-containing protein n=1 Tax=Parathielavia hyrcaniae TaxID=113614 RepID=A0AAN6Q314_9PEZI|nr:hypothetical protein N658DRAFT_523851 [Parathielavia hyrcaniae]
MTQNQSRQSLYQQPHDRQDLPYAFLNIPQQTAPHFEFSDLDRDFDFEVDLNPAGNFHYNSDPSSPVSTHSLLSQYSSAASSPLSAFDSIPTPTTDEPSLFHRQRQSGQAALESSAPFANPATMQTEAWMPNGQLTPRSVGRFSHHRDSSRSSMGSNGPASPYSHNLANPQIAVNDSVGDSFHSFGGAEDLHNYQLAPKPFPGVTHDSFYTTLPAGYGTTSGGGSGNGISGYPYTVPRRRHERGLLAPSERPIGPARSQPVSVASSIASDSPATPAGEPEEDRKRNTGEIRFDALDYLVSPPCSPSLDDAAMPSVPKLDRTMTDAYTDELYNPNFAITSSSSGGHPSMSPTSDLFNQRLQAANQLNQYLQASNNPQHLSATNSPVSPTSRDRSPLRRGSPLLPAIGLETPSSTGQARMGFGAQQRIREQNQAMRDREMMHRQMARSVADTSTPQTISPKDAMLEYREPEGDANFPLFPQQDGNGFNADAVNKSAAAQSQQLFGGLPMDTNALNNLYSSMSTAMQVPQQYPFVAQPRPHSAVPSMSNGSAATTRLGSAETTATESVHSGTPQRPADTSAHGGTYTCTYHGCTMRFETPALLQKHKREGHRQAHGLGGPRRPDGSPGMASTLFNTQAGPHRCDRINPSTGKPCNTVFSRPYDLTRHEDTIHNARKQKVRCDLCTDEKTFSRADALTRHYRVCHPDVEFPGKQRRRGGHGA